ncbi:hypothetical protein KO506_02850 [Polaribacter vadi]|uniref:hypothetical protein n=1 Tax=Polaribacter TaxID=52959 RepID=UPI001C081640|nr:MULTISPECIES: hypothetical protein [Polaribacter]MBU3010331.1 hypothetical protein [Polaribacter vadi]MDO6740138.1 hypothetical protein [Polaribacter sp. 1_MG-2023]
MKKQYKNSTNVNQVYIILNGPSLKKQDLSVLQGQDIMFVNRGFKHELYHLLQPKFHVFVDAKLKTGEWPITWLDEILTMVPDITFIMPVDWYHLEMLKPYKEKGVKFLWMSLDTPFKCIGVSGYCFEASMFCGYKKICFTGFDANGLAYELINHQSHFYGVNEENNIKTSKNYVIDLYMHSRHLRELQKLAEASKQKGIEIINLTEGGLLDMFTRNKLEESVKKRI